MYKITTAERMLQNLVTEYEKLADPRLPACCRKAGKLLETCCSIMDLKGVGVSRVSSVYGYVKSASAISQNYYPERLGKLYLINAPWGFSGAFNFVKGFLDPVTVEKIHILGSDYLPKLLAQVPKENLPKQFGGECECECEGGCALSDAGPWQDPAWAKPPRWAQKKEQQQQQQQQESTSEDTLAKESGGATIDHEKLNEGVKTMGLADQKPVQQQQAGVAPNMGVGAAPAKA
jgi:CRAL/TRIO domain